MAEQGTHNPLVAGSNPAGPTKFTAKPCAAAEKGSGIKFRRIGKSLSGSRQPERSSEKNEFFKEF